jgi:hypothetical protein
VVMEVDEAVADGGGGEGVAESGGGEECATVKLVQRKWQMATCVHFFSVFAGALPFASVAPASGAALTPLLLERAVGDASASASASVIFRDVVCVLLAALKEVPPKQAQDRWFAALTRYVASRPQEFPDCYPGTPGDGDSLLDRFDGDGMSFVFHVSWKCRLGLLQSLCDIAVEEAECVRDVIKEAERLSSATRQEVEARHFRLVPLGRCSQKRFYFCVGGSRIYSGFKRKGAGGVVVECSDVSSMRRLVDVLESSDNVKDAALGTKIRSWYLGPLIEGEERKRRKVDRGLAVEAQREESRRRNADRPRRARASYM